MIEIFKTLAPEFLGGLMAVVCAVIGAKIATHSEKNLKRGEGLRDAYADVLAGYYCFLLDGSDKNVLKITTATECAMLICSPQSEQLMKEIIELLSADRRNDQKIGLKIQELRKCAQNDVEHYLGKKRGTKVK